MRLKIKIGKIIGNTKIRLIKKNKVKKKVHLLLGIKLGIKRKDRP